MVAAVFFAAVFLAAIFLAAVFRVATPDAASLPPAAPAWSPAVTAAASAPTGASLQVAAAALAAARSAAVRGPDPAFTAARGDRALRPGAPGSGVGLVAALWGAADAGTELPGPDDESWGRLADAVAGRRVTARAAH